MSEQRGKALYNLASVSLPIILAVLSAAFYLNASLARFEEQIKQQGKVVESLALSVRQHLEDPDIHHGGFRAVLVSIESQSKRIERLEEQVDDLR